MSAVVRKSSPVVVRPSRPVTMSDTAVKLSSFDKGLEKMPATALLVFENPIHEPANTIMRALSETLVHYYPFAGRIVAAIVDGEEEHHILCNGDGVAFVSATCNCALKEAILLDHSPCERALLKELATFYPAKGCGPTDPLLLMQVTEFSCGGFVLGVTWNHAVADGAGMAQFLLANGELARGLSSPSIAPVRLDDSLPRLPPSMDASSLRQVMLTPDPASLDITVPSRSINLIRAEFGSRFHCQPCTMFEAVCAILWQCRTRAIMSSPDTPSLLVLVANVRKHVGAKLGYYGNCMSAQPVIATSGTVANADILDLVKMINRTKENIPHTFNVNQISNNLTEAANKGQMQQLLGPQLQYHKLVVSSWKNLGYENVDFGSGKTARVTSYMNDKRHIPGCIVCLPCQGDGGANVVSAFVMEKHAEAFRQELAKFM